MDNATMTMLHGMTARVAMHATRGMGRDHLDDVRQVAYLTALEAMPRLDPKRRAEPFLAIAALRRCGNYLDHAVSPVSGANNGGTRRRLRETRGVSIDPVIAWADARPRADGTAADGDLRERVRRAVDAALLEFRPRDAAICRRICALDRWADGDRPSCASVAREVGCSSAWAKRVWARFLRRLRADVVLRELATD